MLKTKMSANIGINHYEGELNIKDIIKKEHLEDIDEALNICDLTSVIKKFEAWKELMPRVKPFYAVKCNDNDIIVKTLADLGTGFDCASKNEIKQVLQLGVDPNRILLANPCKPYSHLDYARKNKVTSTTVDNEFEIYKIYKHFPEVDLVIRLRHDSKISTKSLGTKFGCDPHNDATALMLLAKSLQLNVIGTSFHVGSGCRDVLAFAAAIGISRKLFNFGELIGFNMNLLDIGGGFPGSDDVYFKKIADTVNEAISTHFADEKTKIIAEPGRYFVASAYTLICKIHAKREIRTDGKLHTKMYYLNDGTYGSFNNIIYNNQNDPQNFLYSLVDEKDTLPKFKTVIRGPTGDAVDMMALNLFMPDLSIGDYILFPNMGAYTTPAASPFTAFPIPKTMFFKKIENLY